MKKAIAKIKLVTPCISSGADQKSGEIRSASLRGVLHFWFRVLGGSLTEEQAVFGRIGKQDETRKSSLNVRVKTPVEMCTKVQDSKGLTGNEFDYFLWPLRDQRHTPGAGERGVVVAGEEFDLILSHNRIKDGAPLPSDVFKVALLLGSLGSRSRRCYGSLWPETLTVDGEEWKVPETMADFKLQLEELLHGRNVTVCCWGSSTSWQDAVAMAAGTFKKYRCGSPKSGTPSEWGQNDHDVPLKKGGELFRPALGLPLTQRYSSREVGTWNTSVSAHKGDRDNNRWASPLLLKIVPLQGQYHVLAVFLNEYVLPEGTGLTVSGRNGRVNAKLSLDLWRELKGVGTTLCD